MAGELLLDTNVVIAFLGHDQAAIACIEAAREVFIPMAVLGELYYSAYASELVEHNLASLERLTERVAVLTTDTHTARLYGAIKAGLRTKGRPIPENDIWIAATALQHGLSLATRDAHFEYADGLTVEQL